MIRILEGNQLQSSVVDFKRLDTGHTVRFCSCVHFGYAEYYAFLQKIITEWDGLIFQEKLTGNADFIKIIPPQKGGFGPGFGPVMHKLLCLKSQRQILNYPEDRTIYPDLSCKEFAYLYCQTIQPSATVDSEICAKILAGMLFEPKRSHVVLWYIVRKVLEASCDFGENIRFRERMEKMWATFDAVRISLTEENPENEKILLVYDALTWVFTHESVAELGPERDTAVLRKTDVMRGKSGKDILVVYGAGHYPGIAQGLWDRWYDIAHVSWTDVCSVPQPSFEQFNRALQIIAKYV